jgi:hypothetical protein
VRYSSQRNRILLLCLATLLLLAVLLGFYKKKSAREPFPAGSPIAATVRFTLAVILPQGRSAEKSAALISAIASEKHTFKEVSEFPQAPHESLFRAHLDKDVDKVYLPLSDESVKLFTNGLTAQQIDELKNAKSSVVLEFAHPNQNVWSALRNANELIEDAARKTGGIVWDRETREFFSPDAWHERRLKSWRSEIVDVSTQTVVHTYQNGELVRSISLGMNKVGLPDVVIEKSPWASNNQVVDLINLFCQSTTEGASIGNEGKFSLDLRTIRDADVRDTEIKSLKANATGVARLSLKVGRKDEGDADNRLIELTPDGYDGNDELAQQEKMISSFFGWEDEPTKVRHNAELLEASRQARTHLPGLRKDFNTGLQPGEFIEVKAPFTTPSGGNEWMWVEVTKWDGKEIRGTLENEPSEIPSLHGGQIVQVDEDQIFDYIRQFPDKHQEGNTTGAILQKMSHEGSQ